MPSILCKIVGSQVTNESEQGNQSSIDGKIRPFRDLMTETNKRWLNYDTKEEHQNIVGGAQNRPDEGNSERAKAVCRCARKKHRRLIQKSLFVEDNCFIANKSTQQQIMQLCTTFKPVIISTNEIQEQ